MGIDPPEDVTAKEVLRKAEERDGFGVWEGDLYGRGEVVRGKRARRGWREEMLRVVLGGDGVVGEGVRALCEWDGGRSGREVFGGEVPWDFEVEM